ncbi:MAG: double-strand break repair helicase AddA [Methylocella sp.]
MALFEIPADTRGKQDQASDPNQSVWVSANAGSGKTHVLASRVIRLLLQGVAPARILCLTFTKAAAANMAARVFGTLAGWTQLADAELCAQIVATGAPTPGSQELRAARMLFARALEAPGGLKIQTIHAFCERLLHLFPFEANVPARFEVADDLRQAELLRRARRAVLAEANSGKGTLGAALQRIVDECGPEAFEDLIKEAMRHGAIFRPHALKEPVEILRRLLGVTEGRDVACIEREMAEEGIASKRWNGIAAILDHGSANDQKKADLFRKAALAYLSRRSEGELKECLDCYLAIFFIKDGNGTPRESIVTQPFARAHPEIAAELCAEQLRLDALRAERKAAATCERTGAMTLIMSSLFKRYSTEKAARGILDFDDLIEKSLALLERSDARWVLYKLDAGIDHVLVDEAQDTSEAQWKILEQLTGDFAAGRGQSDGARTFFAVGDEKQSIFSFQGAAPKKFDEMRRKFETRFSDGGQSFTHVPLDFSFRSAPGVLSTIDKVFEHADHKGGLVSANNDWKRHRALKHQLPGLVELWPLAAMQSEDDPRAWTLPLDLLDAQDPANLVANRVAQKIAQIVKPASNEFVHDSQLQRRPVRPGDILILVRTRNAFFEAMIRALKKSGIRTAGADRLELTHYIAVMDLVAAGRVSLLPHDDLALACVLKSPLIGLDDDDLMALAPGRSGSLFDALQASADAKHSGAINKLARWRARAGGGPFAFYANLLGADGGRRAIQARLGLEAGDAIDEFLRLAIAHEEEGAPSLAAFLNDLAGLEYSIKRDMEAGEDAVRIMTVHAAKGLEAKIVFLADTCGFPSANHDPKIFVLDTKEPGEQTVAWSPRKDLDCEAIAAAREKARDAAKEEYKRLFYVALTRAEERLYVAGFHGAKKPEDGCWAKMIEAALANETGIETVPAFWNGEEQIRRLLSEGSGAPAAALPHIQAAAAPPVVLPDWLGRRARIEAPALPPVTPSHALAPPHRLDGPAHARREALRRGRLMHLLLQYLPGIIAEHRRDAALAFLAARATGLDERARQTLAGEALKVIDLPELAGLFAPGSKAEVSFAGRIMAGRRTIDVAGQVDRIGETPKEILVADYKTGAPCGLDGTPDGYIAQMALYRAALAPLWPDKTLRMLLIWTAGPRIVWLPAGMLDAALAAIAAA